MVRCVSEAPTRARDVASGPIGPQRIGFFGGSEGRELSVIRNVARSTTTATPQRGHLGVIVLPVTPSRYDSAQLQCGQGANRPVAIVSSALGRPRPSTSDRQ